MRKPKRMGVLQAGKNGTELAPCLRIRLDGNMAEVLVETDEGTARRRTCKDYVDTPMATTAAGWEAAYIRLETAWAQQAAQA